MATEEKPEKSKKSDIDILAEKFLKLEDPQDKAKFLRSDEGKPLQAIFGLHHFPISEESQQTDSNQTSATTP